MHIQTLTPRQSSLIDYSLIYSKPNMLKKITMIVLSENLKNLLSISSAPSTVQ